ncbi:121R [Invertebrate iridescent virus Kaz2018]|nr:121R [Invertebrate iridescent virus Kaz2018]
MYIIEIENVKENVTINVKKNQVPPIEVSPKIPPIEIENVKENVLCPICLIAKVNTVLECTHVLCSNCVKKINVCPICRKTFHYINFFRL